MPIYEGAFGGMTGKFRKTKITTRVVEGLMAGETVADTDLPGYFVRRQTGAATYFVRKYANGQRHFVTVGEHGREGWTERRARDQALQVIAALKQGRDPATERSSAKSMPTLAQFAADFIALRGTTLKKGTLANYRSLLNKQIAPRNGAGHLARDCLGNFKLDALSHRQVAAVHASLWETPRAANHMLAFLSSVYSEAQAAGLVPEDVNPTQRVKRYTIQARQRFLSEEEIGRVGEVLTQAELDGSEDPYAIAAIRLLILTGCRRNEILDARWDWIDFERGLLNLPDSKTGAKPIYLSPPAIALLRTLPRVNGNPFIIVGAKEGQSWVNLRKVWVRVRVRADLQPTIFGNGKIEQVRIHDLRHSFASLLASGGASLPMIGKLLGHSQPQTTARYTHLTDDPLRRLSDDLGKRASILLIPRQRNQG
ncbi:MAG TPA: tyrosine-type recombinase/integrase [Hyphomicrobiaceae bacterium]|nr:tyrosine-type recombinase/integrase [Hyphomicrobiaceae bacterium]